MKNKIIIILAVLVVIYFGSYFIFTNKFTVQYTSGTCDISRTVKYEWQKSIYYFAGYLELKIFGKSGHKPTIQIETK